MKAVSEIEKFENLNSEFIINVDIYCPHNW